jgi:hypothetical protein
LYFALPIMTVFGTAFHYSSICKELPLVQVTCNTTSLNLDFLANELFEVKKFPKSV